MADGGLLSAAAFDTTVPALVLKLDSYPLHHGGLGVVRSLGRLGRRAVLIPTDDVGAILISTHAERLQTWFRFPQPPPGLAHVVASKRGLYELCSKLGVPCPRVSFPTSRQEVEEFTAIASFPVVAKAIEAWRLPPGEGLLSTTIIRSPESLLQLSRRLERHSDGNLMLQEYLPGGRGQDWFFHAYCDARSRCLASFTGVKLRSYPPYAGATTLGRGQDNEPLRAHAEGLLEAIAYRGIVDLDYRLDLRDGEYKLLDFNPRVGAQFRLFEDVAGVDVVRAAHLDLTGREVHRRPQRHGRVFLVEQSDLLACLGYRRAGDLSLPSWLSSLRGAHRELAWFTSDDPAPFLLMWVRLLLRAVQRLLRRPGGRSGHASTPRYLPGRQGRERRHRRRPLRERVAGRTE